MPANFSAWEYGELRSLADVVSGIGTQTAMRCWDALLSEGAKVLYRVALALLKTHEELLLAQDNAGYVLREMKLACAAMHDRDALLKVSVPVPSAHSYACHATQTLLHMAPSRGLSACFLTCIPTLTPHAGTSSLSNSALRDALCWRISACSSSSVNRTVWRRYLTVLWVMVDVKVAGVRWWLRALNGGYHAQQAPHQDACSGVMHQKVQGLREACPGAKAGS